MTERVYMKTDEDIIIDLTPVQNVSKPPDIETVDYTTLA